MAWVVFRLFCVDENAEVHRLTDLNFRLDFPHFFTQQATKYGLDYKKWQTRVDYISRRSIFSFLLSLD